jgi:hypothetical protein
MYVDIQLPMFELEEKVYMKMNRHLYMHICKHINRHECEMHVHIYTCM